MDRVRDGRAAKTCLLVRAGLECGGPAGLGSLSESVRVVSRQRESGGCARLRSVPGTGGVLEYRAGAATLALSHVGALVRDTDSIRGHLGPRESGERAGRPPARNGTPGVESGIRRRAAHADGS